MKKLFAFLIILICYLRYPLTTHADNNFQTGYNVTYTVNPDGITHANFDIHMQNLNDKYFASSYTLKVSFDNITHIRASDSYGSIIPDVKQTSDGEEITVTFNDHVTGKGNILPFTLSFDTTDIAVHNGAIWEVNIPGLLNQNDFSEFTVHVIVPSTFGEPSYIKPSSGGNNLVFTKEQLGTSGISLAFGQHQAYNFSLTYHLENNQLFPVTETIALPPDTSYQHVEIDSLSPRPSAVVLDQDGNWLATYVINQGQKITPVAKGTVFLFLNPTTNSLTADEQLLYTRAQKNWEANDSHISSLAHELKTPFAIYQFVVKTLHYDFSRVSVAQQRLGAAKVLQNPQSAVCLEFTDLFIALARSAGIPAREVDGFAYTKNTRQRPLSLVQDILHAWPEYYDFTRKSWIMVDPTWENTTGGVDYFHTFDFDHVAFVVKGENSDYPVPAGGYKLPGEENDKDVSVTFAQNTIESVPQITAGIHISNSIFSGFPIDGLLLLTNTGVSLFPSQTAVISSSVGTVKQTHITVPEIPPFGSVSIPFSFGRTSLLTNTKDTITIQFAGKTVTKVVLISPFSLQFFLITGGSIFGLLCITIFITTTKPWRLFIFRYKREDPIRGKSKKS